MPARLRILCVDDDPPLLKALQVALSSAFEVDTAPGPAQALQKIERDDPYAVVVADFEMPELDGVELLGRIEQLVPETTRVLLTGHANLDTAISAINQGHIFRFLQKPVAPVTLLAACQAAAAQHQLVVAERVLLEQTLRGCIKTLTDILALANPTVFRRASRIKFGVGEFLRRLTVPNKWEIEIAAMVSQIGAITIPGHVIERLYDGRALSPAEQDIADQIPRLTEQWLSNIPRLEGVRLLLRDQHLRYDGSSQPGSPKGEAIPFGARILKLVTDFSNLDATGASTAEARETLRGREGWYDPALLQLLFELLDRLDKSVVHEIPLVQATPGMIVAEDLRSSGGALLIARGFELTDGVLERLQRLPSGTLPARLRVVVRASAAAA